MSSNDKSHAKDFFLHAGLIVALYASVIALVNLIFRIINVQFPQVDEYARHYYTGGSPISMPVATLIVAFPLFIYFSHIVYKSYKAQPEKRDLSIRKWLLYITLFIAGIVLAGDLVTVIFYFLDGRELTAGFVLKALTLFVVAGAVFGYYLKDLKTNVSKQFRKRSAVAVFLIILAAIVSGFAVIGSPRTQRLARYDMQKVQALQAIQADINSYYATTDTLPKTLDELYESEYAHARPHLVTPDTEEPYIYNQRGDMSYELCTTFNLPMPVNTHAAGFARTWFHSSGYTCFTRTVTAHATAKPLPVERPVSF